MDLNKIRQERQKWYGWKDIAPLREALKLLPDVENPTVNLSQTVTIEADISDTDKEQIDKVAKMMKPWRKGPFKLFDTFIDSEWRSYIKYDLLEAYFNLKDKAVADVGCNNGYYMFRFLTHSPQKVVGFDPSVLCKTQFDFINHFIKAPIIFELLGVEHIEFYEEKFDTIFCLGVLYHRSDPVTTLKSLRKSLNPNGEIILDTFMIDGNEEIALTPKDRYSKIPNIYFIPTIPALKNWCYRAGFKSIEVLEVKKTDFDEQRKSEWIKGESLESFLDKNDQNYTVEGYSAPKRVYIKAKI